MESGKKCSFKRGDEMSRDYDDFADLSGLRVSHALVEMALHKLFSGKGIIWQIVKEGSSVSVYVKFSIHRETTASAIWYSTKGQIYDTIKSIHGEDLQSLLGE